jgi:hypothetical protein
MGVVPLAGKLKTPTPNVGGAKAAAAIAGTSASPFQPIFAPCSARSGSNAHHHFSAGCGTNTSRYGFLEETILNSAEAANEPNYGSDGQPD